MSATPQQGVAPAHSNRETLAEQTRLVLRSVAKSVWVIACRYQGKKFAMAATAVDAFSLDPPAMLLCVNQNASLHATLAAGTLFSVNLLGASHEAVGRACGGELRGEERFEVGSWLDDEETNVPFLMDAQGTLICSAQKSLRHGTHELFVGDVLKVHLSESASPLVFVNGRYRSLPVPI